MSQVLFIDSAVNDINALVAGIPADIEVVTIQSGSSGLSQIAQALAGRSGIDAVHVISHGGAGYLTLGGERVDAGSLSADADALATIRAALTDDADLLLYGCKVAEGESGSDFIATLAAATGADVAASTDITGAAWMGGNWTLEAASGGIETASLAVESYDGVLASGILRNAYIRFGYSDDGTLGYGSNSKPGVQYDKDGNRNFLDTADFLTPGSPFEFFSVSANGSVQTNNNTNYTSPSMPTTLVSRDVTTVGADTYGSLTYVSYHGALKITQVYTLGATSQVISMQVTMQNTGTTNISGVQYARGIDPDVDSNGLPGSTSSTNNVRGASGIAATDIVLSTGPVSGRIIGLYTNASFAHNTAVTGWTTTTSSYLAGGNVGNGDNVIGVGFDIGTMVPGQSASFSFAYVFAASAAALADSISEVPASNAAPTFTVFAAPLDTVAEDTQVEITFAELAAQGNEADDHGVTAFVVKAVSAGTLKIGTSAGTATAFAPGSNDSIPSNGTLKLYWTPAANANGTLNAFTVVARDADGAVSGTPVQAQVVVTPVNDAPTLSSNAALNPIAEDASFNSGSSVGALFTPRFADVDAGQTLGGIVVTGNSANAVTQGVWQYFSGGSWHDIGAVSEAAGLALTAATAVRFVPVANYNGTPGGLTVHAADSAYAGGYTSGATRVTFDTTTDAVTSGVSDGTRSLTVSVTAVNDAPVFTSSVVTATRADTSAADGVLADVTGTLTATDIESASNLLRFDVRGGSNVAGTVTKTGLYGTLTVDSTTGAWTYAPNNTAAINALPAGASVDDVFEFKVVDPQGAYSLQTLSIHFTGSNDLPVLASSIADQSFSGAGSWTYQVPAATFSDAEGTGLTYTATLADGNPLPAWLTFDAPTRTFTGNPPAIWADAGVSIRVTATDHEGVSVDDTFDLTLSGTANQPPVVVNPLTWAAVDAPNEVTAVAFTGSLGGTTLSLAGTNVALGTAATGADVAGAMNDAFDAASGANYGADVKVGPGNENVLVLTAKAPGARTEFTDGATVNVNGGSYGVHVVAEGVTAVAEQVAVQFTANSNGSTSLSFDGVTIDLTGATTAAEVASAVAAAITAAGGSNWTATVDGTLVDTVHLTAKVAGNVPDLSAADFVPADIFPVSLANSVVVTDGIDGVTEVVELAFTGSYGGASITVDGVNATAGSAVAAADVAAAVAAGSFAGMNAAVQVGAPDTVDFTATVPGSVPDMLSSDFSGTYTGAATPTVTTEGAGWTLAIPSNTFSDPEGNPLTYSAFVIDPGTGAVTPLVDSPALTFDAATATLSGNGVAPASSLVEIRAFDAVSGGSAASQFQLVVYTDTQAASLVAGVVPASVGFVNGAGSGSYRVPATAFSYLDSAAGNLSYSATLGNGDPLPDWLDFDAATGTFTGNPPDGATSVSVIVSADSPTVGIDPVSTPAFTLVIANPNDPLVLTAAPADQLVAEGTSVNLAFTKPFTDPDGGLGGTPTQAGINYSATANGHPLSDYGLTLGVNGGGQLTLTGNPPGGTPFLNIVIAGLETSSGATSSTSFTLNLADPAAGTTVGTLNANNVGAVTVTGTPTQGQTLTAQVPTDADGLSGSVSYQWQVSADGTTWTDIAGSRGQSASLLLAQSESALQVRVQAFYTDNGGVAEAPVSTALAVADLPDPGSIAFTGALVPGQTMTATVSDPDGLLHATPTYQWQVSANGSTGWTSVSGATYSAYTLSNDDGGKYFRVVTSYTDDMGHLESSVISPVRGPVQLGSVAPVASNDSNSVSEAGGAANAIPGSGPAVGNLLGNDTDANVGDTLTVTGVRTGNGEGFGEAATDSGSTFTLLGAYGTLVVVKATGAYTYTLNETHAAVEALQSGASLTDSFNYTVSDNTALSDTAVLNIVINGTNDLPTLTGVVATATVAEDVATALALNTLNLVDPDSTAFSLRLAVDVGTLRAVSADPSVTVTGSDTGSLTISAASTFALRGWLADNVVSYVTAPNANGTVATLSYALNDGSGFVSAGSTTQISATPTNDAPIVDAGGIGSAGNDGTAQFKPRGGAVHVASQLTLSDIDSGSLASATVRLAAGARDNQFGTLYETLALSSAGQTALAAAGLTFSTTSSSAGAVLTVTGAGTVAQYQAVLREVLYNNSNANAFAGDRTITVSVTDTGGQASNAASFATAAANSSIAVGQRIFINGVDSGALVAQVLDDHHFVASRPLVALANGAALTFRDGTGVVTSATAQGPTIATITLDVPWTPVIDMNGGAAGRDRTISYVEGQAAVAVATSDASITDQGGLIRSLTVTLVNPLDNQGVTHERLNGPSNSITTYLADRLITFTGNGTGPNGMTGATAITFTASGAGSDATNFQVALRAVTYVNDSQNPNPTQRQVLVSSTDVDGHVGVNASTYINVTEINDAPVAIASAVGAIEDTRFTFTAGQFGFSDPTDALDGAPDTLLSITLSSLPASGTLYVGAVAATIGQVVTLAQLNAGALTYVPALDVNGAAATTFTFKVQDNGGATNGGVDLSVSAATMTINITAANDAPVFSTSVNGLMLAALAEDVDLTSNGGTTVAALIADGSITDVDLVGAAPEAIAVTAASQTGGTWEYQVGAGPWTAFDFTGGNAGTALLLAASDKVRFVPAADWHGTSAGLTVHAWDKTVGSAGDHLIVAGNIGGTGTLSSAHDSVGVTVTPVNDAPTITLPGTQTVAEDNGHVISGLSFGDVDISGSADGDTSNDDVSVSLSVAHGTLTLGSANGLTITAGANGSASIGFTGSLAAVNAAVALLAYQPAADFSGTDSLSVSIDDGGNVGSGGALTASSSLTINVTGQNDAPVLTAAAPNLGTITEDAVANAGHLVSSFVGSIGGTGVADVDSATLGTSEYAGRGIAVHSLGSTGDGSGIWQYSTDGTTWIAVGTVSATQALLLSSTDKLRFVPDAMNGSVATVGYYLWDGATGASGSKVDVSVRGGTSAFSTGGDTATLTVTSVNDAPAIDLNGAAAGTGSTIEFHPRGDAIALFDANLTLGDVDAGAVLTGAELVMDADATLDNAFATVYETLSSTLVGGVYVGTLGNIVVTGNGTEDSPLRLQGAGTMADYKAAMQTLVYNNENPNAYAGTRPISVTLFDNAPTPAASLAATLLVDVNWAPVADLNGEDDDGRDFAVAYVENDPGVAIAASDAALIDQDGNIASVTVTLTNPIDGAQERLYIDSAQVSAFAAIGITVSGNNTHAVTLTGNQDGTYFQLALRAVLYTNTSSTPDTTQRVVRVTSVDVDGNDGVSAITRINVSEVDDATTGTVTVSNLTDGSRGLTAAQQNDTLSVANTLADADGMGLVTYQWLKDGVVVDGATASTYTLQEADVGHAISVRASYSDDFGRPYEITSNVSNAIVNVNDAPTVGNGLPAQTTTKNVPFAFTVPSDAFADVDAGDSLTYSATLDNGNPLPSWLSFDPITRAFSGTPNGADVGTIAVRVTATDAGSLAVGSSFSLEVTNLPVLAADSGTAREKGGVANADAGFDAVGNALTNDSDLDNPIVVASARSGAGAPVAVTAGSNSATGYATIAGSFGSLHLGADGSYRYVVDETNATVQALRTSADTVLDTFTYTVDSGVESTLSITVEGQNDAPTLVRVSNLQVPEIVGANNRTTAPLSVGMLSAEDPDAGDVFTYDIIGGADQTYFQVATVGGVPTLQLKSSVALNAEQQSSFSVVVRSTDSSGVSHDETFVVQVGDIDEFGVTSPQFDVQPISGLAPNTLPEEMPIGSSIGVVARSVDGDATHNTVVYSLVGNSGGTLPYTAGEFAIDASSGALRIAGRVDFETGGPTRTVFVKATSSDGSTAISALTLNIVDTAPKVVSISPADEARNVAVASDVTVQFNETIVRGNGTVTLKDGAGTVVATYDAATSDRLTFSGNTLTINPVADLAYTSDYTVEIGRGVVVDRGGNAAESVTTYNFSTFNIPQYLASHGDLIEAYGGNYAAAQRHYVSTGMAEGRTATFDPLSYVASYGDLVEALGSNPTAAITHFINWGYWEGRTTTFDPLSYVASYGDLIEALGARPAAATQHFINAGYAEGRTTTFDALRYIASYGDLTAAYGANPAAGVKHYIAAGYSEGRVASFDANLYLSKYADLRAAYGSDDAAALRHFIQQGYGEGRTDSNAGSDVLQGSASGERIDGGAGDDVIDGRGGNDVLIGGAGSDTFVFSTALNGLTNVDTILDFQPGTDHIQLAASIFTALTPGQSVTPGEFVQYDAATGVLSYDADGNGAGAGVSFAVIDDRPVTFDFASISVVG